MTRATPGDIAGFITAREALCAQDGDTRWHTNDRHAVLFIDAASIGDARMWLIAFGDSYCDHWRLYDDRVHGTRNGSGFIPWQGWHVMVHAEEPLQVPASVADRLVLAGGQR